MLEPVKLRIRRWSSGRSKLGLGTAPHWGPEQDLRKLHPPLMNGLFQMSVCFFGDLQFSIQNLFMGGGCNVPPCVMENQLCRVL